VDIGLARGRELVSTTARELGSARRNAALSQAIVAHRVGISPSQYSRIERGLSLNVPIPKLAMIAAILGLDLSIRLYPAGDAVRDAAQIALLDRFRRRLHPSLVCRTEVPLPGPADLRDAVVRGFRILEGRGSVRGAVEAETRPRDVQALERRLALKQRDGGVDWLILLLADTRHNRTFVAGPGSTLRARFPLDGRRALELLEAGVDLARNSIVLL